MAVAMLNGLWIWMKYLSITPSNYDRIAQVVKKQTLKEKLNGPDHGVSIGN
jgi:hypothetical protein